MPLTDIVIDIHQRETGVPLSEALVAELRELAGTYGVDEDPRWLLPIFAAVQQGSEIAQPVFIESDDTDPDSYLFELATMLNWKFDHPGEYDAVEFPRLGRRIYVSREARSPISGQGGSTYKVTAIA